MASNIISKIKSWEESENTLFGILGGSGKDIKSKLTKKIYDKYTAI